MKNKEKRKYIFPSKIAAKMKKISTRAQLEASMMSMTLIMVGMVLLAIHQLLYSDMGWGFKSLLIFNLLCGFFFISSYLVTTYQQWVNHLEVMNIDPDIERAEIKAQGNIFKRIRKISKARKAKKKEFKMAKKILKRQGKVKFKFNVKKSKRQKKEIKLKEDIANLIEEQRRFLEE